MTIAEFGKEKKSGKNCSITTLDTTSKIPKEELGHGREESLMCLFVKKDKKNPLQGVEFSKM